VLNHAFDSAIDQNWPPPSARRCLDFPDSERLAQRRADFLDDVPVMSATVLGLDMLLQEPCIDLRMASELVLSDVGATIQILRLIGREYDFAAEYPRRMEECIASLDARVWFSAISARTFVCDREHSATTAVWNHCRLIAQYARLVAESLGTISPDDAYLVGLLHEIGSISTVLGWPNNGPCATASDPLLALESSLPQFVLSAVHSAKDSCPSSTWSFILVAAHELAGEQHTIY